MVDVFLSAENPSFQKLSPEENEERMLQLMDDLTRIGIPKESIHVSRYTEKSGYGENAFFITGIELEDAIGLAERYNQVEMLTDEGIVDIKSMKLKLPTKQKIIGPEAETQEHYSMIEGLGPVSYQFTDPDVQHEQTGSDLYNREARIREFVRLADETADDIMNSPLGSTFNAYERDALVAEITNAKQAVLNDNLEEAAMIFRKVLDMIASPPSEGIPK